MKILAEILAGSHLYGLATPTSDWDIRYVFLHTDHSKFIGLDRIISLTEKTDQDDKLGFELPRFIQLLQKTNAQMVEMLYAEEFRILDPEFKRLVLDQKQRLMNGAQLYSSLLGYIQSELRLALGERKGKEKGKRRTAVDQFGFSPKNFSHIIRLCRCGVFFFKHGFYPSNIMKYDKDTGEICLDIKLNPENWDKDLLLILVKEAEDKLKRAYAEREFNFEFDEEYANYAILKLYHPVIKEVHDKIEEPPKKSVLLPLQ